MEAGDSDFIQSGGIQPDARRYRTSRWAEMMQYLRNVDATDGQVEGGDALFPVTEGDMLRLVKTTREMVELCVMRRRK